MQLDLYHFLVKNLFLEFLDFALLPSILKTHFQEKSVVPADSSPVILVMLEMR